MKQHVPSYDISAFEKVHFWEEILYCVGINWLVVVEAVWSDLLGVELK